MEISETRRWTGTGPSALYPETRICTRVMGLPAGPMAPRVHWVYLLAVIPTITEWIESGSLPMAPRDLITDIVMTVLLLVAAGVICRQAGLLVSIARTDTLTGFRNRRSFQEDLPRDVLRARRLRAPLCLAYLDVDGFKAVNDLHGHAEGDVLLWRLCGFLGSELRAGVDTAYRLGGDEFAIVMLGTDLSTARIGLDRVREAAQGLPVALSRYGASLSIGLVELQAGESGAALVQRADFSMYVAKSKGGNRIEG